MEVFMLAKRAYLVKEGLFEVKEEDVRITDPHQVLVKVKVCGLCNWELNFWKGTGDGYTDYPYLLGHEWAGEVVEIGEDVTRVKVGDIVTVMDFGGYGEYAAVDESNCYIINDGISIENATGEPLKCVTTVLRAAAPEAGDNGLVLGCGPMGLWCIQALAGKTLGSLIAVDVSDDKLALAKKYGATHTINPLKENTVEAVKRITGEKMCDFVIEGTGIPKLLNEGMLYLRKVGRLILMSSHEESCKDFDFRPAIERSLTIIVAHPAISKPDDMDRAVAMINNGTFHNEDIISHRFSVDQLNEAFSTLEHKPKDFIKGVISYDD